MEGSLDKDTESTECKKESFKKPILIGKVGKLPRKTTITTLAAIPQQQENLEQISSSDDKINDLSNEGTNNQFIKESHVEEQIIEKDIPHSYVEPFWSGIPLSRQDYVFEVLKSGMIIEKINLMTKPFWIFGRLPSTDIYMAHPTVSRYHAVIQYKNVDSEDMPAGFYIYDLGSTHGTFLNKSRLKPKVYARIQVGHMLRIGCSTRTLLLTGPDDDIEEESELSVTELKQKRVEQLQQRQEAELEERARIEKQIKEQQKRDEERGIDWGMGEDADEVTDLSENPFAETNNEQLYIEDPKKTLRGFMEREGLELNYDCTEQGIGQFLCRVNLPLDDLRGRPIVAEALVKGKKKEAVVQCALEACRILDRHGVLRQAVHESKKRKAKNWEENDFYDSDDDTFLDRTGTIERKREKRMQAKQAQQPETYQSLCAKEAKLSEQIKNVEKQFYGAKSGASGNKKTGEVDSLDSYMNELDENKPDKYTIAKLKAELVRLKKEHANIVRLANIAKPANLPPLVLHSDSSGASSSSELQKKTLPIFGKRLKVKVTLPSREVSNPTTVDDKEEENDSDDDSNNQKDTEINQTNEQNLDSNKGIIQHLEMKLLNCDETALSTLDDKVKAKISKTVTKLRKIAEEEESIVVEEKRLAVQKRKIIDLVTNSSEMDPEKQVKLSNALNRMTDEFCLIGDRKMKMIDKINKLADDINKIAIEIKAVTKAHHEEAVNKMKSFVEKAHSQQVKIFNELQKIEKSIGDTQVMAKLKELYDWLNNQKNKMMENLEKLKNTKLTENSKLIDEIMEFETKSEIFISTILEEINKIRNIPDDSTCADEATSSSISYEQPKQSSDISEKKKRKNIKRIIQRQERAEAERQKQYDEDASKEDYNMWVPPKNQTGDGRTNLNEKYGY